MIKRRVVYIKLLSPLQMGLRASVVPLNHISALVQNWHPATTSPVRRIEADGKTFETDYSIYIPIQNAVDDAERAAVEELQREVAKRHAFKYF